MTIKVKTPNGSSSIGKNLPSNELIMADTFPAKAYMMIDHCDKNDPDVACWNDLGDMFIVSDTSKLSKTYLPQYFKHAKFQSFVRQLNLYGFRSVKNSNDSSSSLPPEIKKSNGTALCTSAVMFRHDDFKRDHGHLLDKIKRAKKGDSSTSTKKKKEATATPTKGNGKSVEPKKVYTSPVTNGIDKEITMSTRLEMMEVRLRDVSLIHRRMEEMSHKLDVLISIMTSSENGKKSNGLGGGIILKGLPEMDQNTFIIPNGKRRRHDDIREDEKMNGEFRTKSPVSISDKSEEFSHYSGTSSLSSSADGATGAAIVAGQKVFTTMEAVEEKMSDSDENEMQEDEFKNFIDSMLDEDVEDDRKPSASLSADDLMDNNNFDADMGEADDPTITGTDMASPVAFRGEGSDNDSGELNLGRDQHNQMSMGQDPGSVFLTNAEKNKPAPDPVHSEMEGIPNQSNAIVMHASVHAEAVPDRRDDYDEEDGRGRGRNNDINTVTAEIIPHTISTDERTFRCTPFRWFMGIAILCVVLANIIVWPIVSINSQRNDDSSDTSATLRPPPAEKPSEDSASSSAGGQGPGKGGSGQGYGQGGSGQGLGHESVDSVDEESEEKDEAKIRKKLKPRLFPKPGKVVENDYSKSPLLTDFNVTWNGQSFICSNTNT